MAVAKSDEPDVYMGTSRTLQPELEHIAAARRKRAEASHRLRQFDMTVGHMLERRQPGRPPNAPIVSLVNVVLQCDVEFLGTPPKTTMPSVEKLLQEKLISINGHQFPGWRIVLARLSGGIDIEYPDNARSSASIYANSFVLNGAQSPEMGELMAHRLCGLLSRLLGIVIQVAQLRFENMVATIYSTRLQVRQCLDLPRVGIQPYLDINTLNGADGTYSSGKAGRKRKRTQPQQKAFFDGDTFPACRYKHNVEYDPVDIRSVRPGIKFKPLGPTRGDDSDSSGLDNPETSFPLHTCEITWIMPTGGAMVQTGAKSERQVDAASQWMAETVLPELLVCDTHVESVAHYQASHVRLMQDEAMASIKRARQAALEAKAGGPPAPKPAKKRRRALDGLPHEIKREDDGDSSGGGTLSAMTSVAGGSSSGYDSHGGLFGGPSATRHLSSSDGPGCYSGF